MSTIFTVIVVILAVLAIIDLIVGVSNDAVNFLNSALGAKIASPNVILAVAAIGILVGVLTSSGMMEVARHGVMRPEMFTFKEVMFVFAGMMLADVLLLNTFNSLGLPTSTTVSLISELLGATVAAAIFKIAGSEEYTFDNLGQFLNTSKVLAMFTGILASVVIAFTVGGVLMYFSRILFSFRYQKAFKRYGAVWCALAMTGILYFAIFKGLKSSGLINPEIYQSINDHILMVFAGVWLAVSLLFALLQFVKVNVMKITILAGTFSLALAFAGNDLVNFIGVPIAGFDSYAHVVNNNNNIMMTMEYLNDNTQAKANIWYIIAAGVIMMATLFFSRDAMKVAATQLSLSSQREEKEKYNSTAVSRNIVRLAININKAYNAILPSSVKAAISRRFEPLTAEERGDQLYDNIRAVVNISAAAALICIGTALKLPLSTTYVVFMVAMGSSLADRAWGRDSAVYRITGVMVVISGWFVTAFAGFFLGFVISIFLLWAEWIALIIVVLLCTYALTYRFFKKSGKKDESNDEVSVVEENTQEDSNIMAVCTQQALNTTLKVSNIYNRMLVALFTQNRKVLKDAVVQSREIYEQAKDRKYNILSTIRLLENENIPTSHYYVQIVDYISEVTKALLHCTRPAYEHVDNNHRPLTQEQIIDLKTVNDEVDAIFKKINTMLQTEDYSDFDSVLEMRDALFNTIAKVIKHQINRIQTEEDASTKASVLYFNILSETKTMMLQARNLLKSQGYFIGEMIEDESKHETESQPVMG